MHSLGWIEDRDIEDRVVQLNLTPEIEEPNMLFDRPLSFFSMTSLKQHMEYFNSSSWTSLYVYVTLL